MLKKIKVNQIVVVEGKYDAIKLDSIIEGLIIPIHGFSIFSDDEKKQLLKNLGSKYGIILITDSDTAGFKIRTYIQNICKTANIINVYIPDIKGKEARKAAPSKEGLLGVEGVENSVIIKALTDAGVIHQAVDILKQPITYLDLYNLNLSGKNDSSINRKKLCEGLNIPKKLSKKSFLEVLNRMTDITSIEKILNIADNNTDTIKEKPTLFWDFHGTLTLHIHQWYDATDKLIKDNFPNKNISQETIIEHLSEKCIPWYTYPERDTRHILADNGWWRSCNEELYKMFIRIGLTAQESEQVYRQVQPYIVSPANNPLHNDTIAVLEELKARGYHHHLLSNNYPELDIVMEQLGLAKYFETMTISGQIGYAKPRKEIFEHAINLAGSPKEFIMIGDNLVDDIKGAKAVGFTTIWLDSKGRNNEHADYVCKTLTEILEILK